MNTVSTSLNSNFVILLVQCICPTGTRLNPVTQVCEDINECRELGPDACFNGACVNSVGSYERECEPGFILDNSLIGVTCFNLSTVLYYETA